MTDLTERAKAAREALAFTDLLDSELDLTNEVIEGKTQPPASGVSIDPRDGRMIIATLEGLHWVDPGDWVIRGVAGEFYPCKCLRPDPATVVALVPVEDQ